MLFLAALSSCLGGAKVVTAALREQWRSPQVSGVLIGIAAIVALGGAIGASYAAPEWTIAGRPVLDAVDRFIRSNGTILAAIVSSLVLGWSLAHEHLCRQFGMRQRSALGFAWLVRIAPLALAAWFALGLVASSG